MVYPPPAPPPRRDIPKPDNMTDEKYAAFLQYLADSPPDSWRNTDGTIYLTWHPLASRYASQREASLALRPDDPDYGRYLDDLLPHFDYAGRTIPHAASANHDAEAW
jgi:hypothetical protein